MTIEKKTKEATIENIQSTAFIVSILHFLALIKTPETHNLGLPNYLDFMNTNMIITCMCTHDHTVT